MPEQTAEQTIETPVIWDASALIMTSPNHSFTFPKWLVSLTQIKCVPGLLMVSVTFIELSPGHIYKQIYIEKTR